MRMVLSHLAGRHAIEIWSNAASASDDPFVQVRFFQRLWLFSRT